MEKILIAAIWYNDETIQISPCKNLTNGIIRCGYRHGQCIKVFSEWLYPNFDSDPNDNKKRLHFLNNSVQGFLTNKNRFVDRQEAYEIAKNADQIVNDIGVSNELYSEHLY